MSLPDCINHQDLLLTLDTSKLQPIMTEVLPGLSIHPLFLDPEKGTWVLRVKFAPNITLPKHFHTGVVHFYTLSGCWNYVEYPDQPQTAGCYLYEPGGSIHTFHSSDEGSDGLMVIEGANINFDEDGNFVNIMDAGWIEQSIIAAAKKQGVVARYIKPKQGVGFSDED